MFKRPRLRPTFTIVNASLAASVIFLAACSPDTPEIQEKPSENNATVQNSENSDRLQLQAVWATSPLAAPITSLAFAGGSEPILAVSLSTGDLQLFNMQGDRIGDLVDLEVKTLATGQAVVLNDAAITLFPGIGTNGDLKLYAYAAALGDPVGLDLLPGIGAAGLCAGPPLDGSSIMQVAYWTVDKPAELIHGHVQQDADGNLNWSAFAGTTQTDGPIGACIAEARLDIARREGATGLAVLNKYGRRLLFSLSKDGGLELIENNGRSRSIAVSDGITVRVPKPASAMAILSEVAFGNYPDGLIVLGGPVNGEHQVTLIEPTGLVKR